MLEIIANTISKSAIAIIYIPVHMLGPAAIQAGNNEIQPAVTVEIAQGNRTFNTGIVVDHVQEVLDIAGGDIEEAPQFGSSVCTDFILGMGKIADTVKILLDIDKVLAGDDFSGFAGA